MGTVARGKTRLILSALGIIYTGLAVAFALTACGPRTVTPTEQADPVGDAVKIDLEESPSPALPTPTIDPEISKELEALQAQKEIETIAQEMLGGDSSRFDNLTEQQRKAVVEILAENSSWLAEQIAAGKVSLSEATIGWNVEQKLELSQALLDLEHKKQPNPVVRFKEEVIQMEYQTGGVATGEMVDFRESAQFAVAATVDADGRIVYRGLEGDIVTTVGLDFFKEETELARQIIEGSTRFSFSEWVQENPSSKNTENVTFLPEGVKFWIQEDTNFVMFPAIIYRGGYEAFLGRKDWWDQDKWIVIQVVVPVLDSGGEMQYLKIINIPAYELTSYGPDKKITSWYRFEEPGLGLDVFDGTPVGPDSAGQPVLINVANRPASKYFSGGRDAFASMLTEVFGVVGQDDIE